MSTNILPFTKTYKKTRTIQPAQAARAEWVAADEKRKQAQRDANTPPPHPYDLVRPDKTKLAFAEHILRHQGQLTTHHGHDWLDGKYATPLAKLDAANRVLTRLKLRLIPLRKGQ